MAILSAWANKSNPSAIQKMLSLSTGPGSISFALGLPSEALFPISDYRKAILHVVDNHSAYMQYAPPSLLLKEYIVKLMQIRKVECRAEQVFLVSGAQQGMNLLSRLFLEPHDNVLVDEATYSGFMQAIEPFQPTILTARIDHLKGVNLDIIESYCKQEKPPRLIYAIPEGHNPLGISMTEEQRIRLVELANTYHVPIIEDDTYGFLSYQDPLPPLKSYCDKWVFYVGSFSKILAPSLRVGWLIVPEKLVQKLEILKEGSDINTATFSQRTLLAFIEAGHLPEHLSKICQVYKEKRDMMLTFINKHLPELECSVPTSGFFIWGKLPDKMDTTKLFEISLREEKVSFLPGSAFALSDRNYFKNCLRLNFSHCPPELIEEGIKRLARAVRKL